ncbi:hypothetical protein L1887_51207 [Cichorium endivia]|nr:hypothetical protein L1887_51207 [Cichorium endivia]
MGVYVRAMSSGVGYVGLAATLGNTSQLERFLAVAGSRVLPQSMIVPMSKIDALTRPKLSVTKPRCEPFAPFTDVAGTKSRNIGLHLDAVQRHGEKVAHQQHRSRRQAGQQRHGPVDAFAAHLKVLEASLAQHLEISRRRHREQAVQRLRQDVDHRRQTLAVPVPGAERRRERRPVGEIEWLASRRVAAEWRPRRATERLGETLTLGHLLGDALAQLFGQLGNDVFVDVLLQLALGDGRQLLASNVDEDARAARADLVEKDGPALGEGRRGRGAGAGRGASSSSRPTKLERTVGWMELPWVRLNLGEAAVGDDGERVRALSKASGCPSGAFFQVALMPTTVPLASLRVSRTVAS